MLKTGDEVDVIIAAMTLNLTEVEHIADLARLQLSQDEKDRFCEQLSAILEHAARLQRLDTSGVLPTSSGLPAHSALREDEARPGLPRDVLLQNAPQTEQGQFRVPAVLE
jgi:aspartyl-tRNA(Asn)/glutamyl-tRNA(Gln) amidotransferase subunit C